MLNELNTILLGVLILLLVTYCFMIFNKKPCVVKSKIIEPKPSKTNGLDKQYQCTDFSSCDTTGFMNFIHYK